MSKEKKYYLGLDIGTNSVGFAVTDENYNLIRKRGKHLWGARLFEEAQTAADRRAHRASRRRLVRRRQRIILLRSLFEKEITSVDNNFFARLDSSYVFSEEKPSLIFDDAKKEAKYYKEYPTIFHLRKAIIEGNEKFDIRLVYLTIAHIIKYRGNFLMEVKTGKVGNSADDLKILLDQLNGLLKDSVTADEDDEKEISQFDFSIDSKKAEKILDIFKSEIGKSEGMTRLKDVFAHGKDKQAENILKAINGSAFQLHEIFSRLKEQKDNLKKLDLGKDTFEDDLAELPLTDEEGAVMLKIKEIYDYRVLARLLKGEEHLSDAMVKIYTAHRDDLGLLKKSSALLSEADKEALMNGRKKESGSYATYVGTALDINGKERTVVSVQKSDTETFYKTVKKYLKLDELAKKEELVFDKKTIKKGDEDWKRLEVIASKIESESFMPKQNNKNNGVFPYQLNESELESIIHSQGKYYPFLLEKDKGFPHPEKEDYKLLSLLRYRIPYYVGPLGGNKDMPNHWAIRKEGKVTPWNFFSIVDAEQSGVEFMKNLRNNCSYIYGEETLPKFSLTYQEFEVLNELNNLHLNSAPLSKEDKEYLFENLYLKERNITPVKVKNKLKEKYGEKITLTSKGSEDEDKVDFIVKSSLSSWIDMTDIFDSGFYKDSDKFKKAEEAIKILSVFEDNDNRLRALRSANLGLNEDQLKKLANKRYKGFGRLSYRLLREIQTPDNNGEVRSILKTMEDEGSNFMEIYEDPSRGYKEIVAEINKGQFKNQEELIEETNLNPAMKRAFRQALKIVEELKHICHIDSFDKIFVETTRSKQESKITKSRRKKLEEFYEAAKKVKDEAIDVAIKNCEEKLGENGFTDDMLKSKSIFLYFMQLGHDVYTGEEIILDDDEGLPFETLGRKYDIDHIIPQALLKDDSFTNTVLVAKGVNSNKKDKYPLPKGTITVNGREWIEKLYKIKGNKGEHLLMPSEKYSRLIRSENNPLKEEEIAGFINRQLVMTSMSVKATCEALKALYPQTEIVYSKASLVSDFRNVFDIIKVRDLNNYHHAHDAYLNIVVGNVYSETFSSRVTKKWFEEHTDEESKKTNAENFFNHNHYGRDRRTLIYDAGVKAEDEREFRTGGTIDLVRETIEKRVPMTSTMMFEKGGALFNATIYGRNDIKAAIPLKQKGELSDVSKYGGYSGSSSPFFSLVKSKKGKKYQYSLEGIPAVILSTFDDENEAISHYLENESKLEDVEVIIPKVLIKTVILVPGKDDEGRDCYSRLSLNGKSDSSLMVINLSEPALSRERAIYLRTISKFFDPQRNNETKHNAFSKEENDLLLDEIINLSKKPNFATIPEISTTIYPKYDLVRNNLSGFDVSTQARLIMQIYKLLLCQSARIDLSCIGLSKASGIKRLPKVLTPGTKLIATSPTGFYEKVLFEVPKE